jgi:ribosomal protein S18 acetylase RimI-like enzyme
MSSTTSYQVRSATLRDAKAIAEIHANAIDAAYRGILPDDYLRAVTVEKRQAFWREAIEYCEPQVLVATDADKVIGFVGFDRSRDKGSPATTGEIWAIYLAPAYLGQGAGLALWDAAREGLQEEGCTKVTLWLSLANERVLRFFDLAGFKRELPSAKTVPMGGVKVQEIRLKRDIR